MYKGKAKTRDSLKDFQKNGGNAQGKGQSDCV